MAWGIDLIQISNPQVRHIRNRLLRIYLGVMIGLLGTFGVIAYRIIEHECNQEVNDRLQQLAESAARTLPLIKHEYDELVLKEKVQSEALGQAEIGQTKSTSTPLTLAKFLARYKNNENSALKADAALEIPPRSVLATQTGLEWFNADKRIMILEGYTLPQHVLPSSIKSSGMFLQSKQIRGYILPVYESGKTGDLQIMGYVRAHTSTVPLEKEVQRLQIGLGLSGVTMLGILIMSSIWLMRESIKPTLTSLEQLKQFTADASHELRNPLTAIRASVAVMQRYSEQIHPADKARLGAIASASEQMSRLVEDLLLLARIEQTPMSKKAWLTIDLHELLEDLLFFVESEAAQKHITLKSNLTPNVWIQGNGEQLKRLFLNLLSNALQHTPSGGSVTVSMLKQSDYLVVAVKDTGVGIAPEHLSHVFDRFWRAEPARQTTSAGFGLGLAIAQMIAVHHGGEITVTSQPSVGSQFWVYFPNSNSQPLWNAVAS
jgi:signal transduction histidine kinase